MSASPSQSIQDQFLTWCERWPRKPIPFNALTEPEEEFVEGEEDAYYLAQEISPEGTPHWAHHWFVGRLKAAGKLVGLTETEASRLWAEYRLEAELEVERLERQSLNRTRTYQPWASSRCPAEGFVYLMGNTNLGYYKIGLSSNVDRRLTQISPKTPFQVEILHSIPVEDMRYAEGFLHRRFASVHTNGEWFRLTKDDVAFIKHLAGLTIAEIERAEGTFDEE